MLTFPNIDRVMIHLGPIPVYWYGMAYVVGLLAGRQYAVWLAKRFMPAISKNQIDDFMMWALAGIIIGGRLGHILFFDLSRYGEHPLEIFMTWKGGMSFHGGLIGVVIAGIVYCRKKAIPKPRFGDMIATISPIGLLLGRLANFVNEELPGRVTDRPWGMIFPHWGSLPRHPSQLYEAFLEGLVLLAILHICWRIPSIRDVPGRIMGVFLFGYGLARTSVEFVREPDGIFAVLGMDLTTGQILSIPLIIIGGYFAMRKGEKVHMTKNGF